MKSIIALSCLSMLLFSTHNIFAQSKEYVKGYMITASKDTIVGYIKDDKPSALSKQFSFKRNPKASSQTFTSTDAIGFYFEPSFYFDLVEVETEGEKQQQFARKLTVGYTNLYKFTEGEYTNFVLEKENGEKLQITKRDSTVGSKYYEDKSYFGELKLFFKDCQDIAANTKSIYYDEKTIAKLVDKYNECVQPEAKNVNIGEGRKLITKFGLSGGFYTYEAQISGLQAPKRFLTAESNTYRIGGVVSLSYFSKLSAELGIYYSRYDFPSTYTFSAGSGEVDHDIKTLEFSASFRYHVLNKRASPYIIGSLNSGKTLSASSSEVRMQGNTIVIDEAYDILFNRVFGYSAGVGYSIPLGARVAFNIDVTYKRLELYYFNTADGILKGFVVNGTLLF